MLTSLMAMGYADLPAQDAATGPSSAKPGRIVILGDSITAGFGLTPEDAYPALLQRKVAAAQLPYTVVNSGLSGDTTAGGLRRVDWVMGLGADVLIVALGGNDGLRGLPPEQTRQNLRSIIDKARKKAPAVKVIVAGMQMPPSMGQEFAEKFSAVFPEVAKEEHATLLPFLLAGVGGDPSLNQDDQIHPNVKGQQKVAESVWSVLQPLLKK